MKFYFSWENGGLDKSVTAFSVSIKQKEGELARALVKISREENVFAKRYARITLDVGDGPSVIFCGRVTNVPVSIEKDLMLVELIARPSDLDARIAKLFEHGHDDVARFFPGYLGSSALESSPSLYYIDKATHEVSLSNIVAGERIIDLRGKYHADSFNAQYLDEPFDALDLKLTAVWNREVSHVNDIYGEIAKKFDGRTLSGDDYIKKFNAIVKKIDNSPNCIVLSARVKKHSEGTAKRNLGQYRVRFEKSRITGELVVETVSHEKRVETFSARIINRHQGRKSGRIKTLSFAIKNAPIGPDMDGGGNFFLCPLGRAVIRHALARADSFLKFSTRCIYVTFSGEISDMALVTTNDSVFITNPIFGQSDIIAKVIKTELFADSERRYAKITAAISLGCDEWSEYIEKSRIVEKRSDRTIHAEEKTTDSYECGSTREDRVKASVDIGAHTPAIVSSIIHSSTKDNTSTSGSSITYTGPKANTSAPIDFDNMTQTVQGTRAADLAGSVVEDVSVRNTFTEQERALLLGEFASLDDLGAAAESAKTDVRIRLRNPRGAGFVRTDFSVPEIETTSLAGALLQDAEDV